jgi:radical SAM protein with 4Fe4S-binding SPASM domain
MKLNDIIGKPKQQLEEAKQGKMSDTFQSSLVGGLFTTDRFYDIYRMSMIAARLPEDPADIDVYSWIGQSPYVGGYTEEEIEIAKKALKAMGADIGQHVKRAGSHQPPRLINICMTKRYCAAPWHGLHINPQGDVKTCCAGNPNMLGNINTHTIDEILNGEILTEVRSQMKQGIFHQEYCSNCIHNSDEWKWHNSVNHDFDYQTATLDYAYPTTIDVRWNSTCNMSCNYCSPGSSSSWAAILNQPEKAETRKHIETVFNLVTQHADKIVEVLLVGGEPLLLKENIKLLEALKGTDTKIVAITNLNVDLQHNKVFQLLKQHQNVGWSLSFDNIGERFEYVRHGGSWDLHQKNVDIIIDLINDDTKNHSGGIHAVYSLYNCTRMVEFKEWAQNKGLSILWNQTSHPPDIAVHNQNDKIRQLAINEIDKYLNMFDLDQTENDFHLRSKRLLSESTYSVNPTEFTKRIETEYHPDTYGQFEKLWPEIYQALGPL